MKLSYKILVACVVMPLCSAVQSDEDSMLDAIKKVDRHKINQLLIPGFFIRNSDKKRYFDESQAVTNYTYKRLNYYRTTDLFRVMSALVKMGIGGLIMMVIVISFWVSVCHPFG